jgi:predicted nucleotidyltransferase
MYINYIKSESTIKPELVDTTSSKKYVYLRKDIIETQKVDEFSNETITLYEYQEAKLTKAEYQEYLAELSIIDIQQQRADIDYIAIMTGIDLEV